jgi:hypothetical protein
MKILHINNQLNVTFNKHEMYFIKNKNIFKIDFVGKNESIIDDISNYYIITNINNKYTFNVKYTNIGSVWHEINILILYLNYIIKIKNDYKTI